MGLAFEVDRLRRVRNETWNVLARDMTRAEGAIVLVAGCGIGRGWAVMYCGEKTEVRFASRLAWLVRGRVGFRDQDMVAPAL